MAFSHRRLASYQISPISIPPQNGGITITGPSKGPGRNRVNVKTVKPLFFTGVIDNAWNTIIPELSNSGSAPAEPVVYRA